ncbi:hypothetical protein BABINDRAFT_56736 [Babjeviella inositovora NRRL Y-12698]|uniref:NAD(P)H-hydrate epimerase n=1 Tax=Babjeviella inositovora NRRL Y-12698 TaxID=984486 RepID=A0A1E3QYZ2_9ASCO|nr:uncharacterized protein BABINDRAFT_56736 [Babjeviella inositovora NRRL Y-12698]ODQ82774.1 hypothetical protein BABINDRAFT_56736 [Babjeviella inositovora NRRL Y-12698]
MSPVVGYSLDQLMELAGLAVAQAIYKTYPPESHPNVLFLVGPGNNGGDGLVACRHLKLLGYNPSYYYPKQNRKIPLFESLQTQLALFKIPEVKTSINDDGFKEVVLKADILVDSIFGFSFSPPIREPFGSIIDMLIRNEFDKPIVSVDIPSGWNVDEGPVHDISIQPSMLVSLTAPKPCSLRFTGIHYLGGRFISAEISKKYDITAPEYSGIDQVCRIN